jgi:tRNA modification GTPase
LPQKYDKDFYNSFGCIVEVCAKSGQGIEKLKNEIENKLINKNIDLQNDRIITNIRHFETLKKAHEDLTFALEALEKGFTFDVISIDIQNAIQALGEIIGTSVGEIINNI